MNWRERMDVLADKKDAIDEKALEKFNEWVSMAEGDFTREDCVQKGYHRVNSRIRLGMKAMTHRYRTSCSTATLGASPPCSREISAMSERPAGTQAKRDVARSISLLVS